MSDLVLRAVTDAKEWNGLVRELPGADFRQGWEWGELRARSGWSATRLAVFEDMTCLAACSTLTRDLPVVGPVMYAPRGPIGRSDHPEALDRLVAAVVADARRRCAIALRISPPLGHGHVEAALARAGFLALAEDSTTWNTPRQTQAVDLTPDETTLLRAMRRRFREHVSSAPRRGLVVEPSVNDDDLRAFHTLLIATGRLKGIPVRDLAYYRAILELYAETRSALMLIARLGGRVVGGVLSVRFGDQMTMLHTSVRSGVTEAVRHGVAPLMFWELMRRAKRDGCVRLDLGGSGVKLPPQDTDLGWGVYRFKAGLGAHLDAGPPYRDLALAPARYRLLRMAERRMLPSLWRLASQVALVGAWCERSITA